MGASPVWLTVLSLPVNSRFVRPSAVTVLQSPSTETVVAVPMVISVALPMIEIVSQSPKVTGSPVACSWAKPSTH